MRRAGAIALAGTVQDDAPQLAQRLRARLKEGPELDRQRLEAVTALVELGFRRTGPERERYLRRALEIAEPPGGG